MVCLQEVEPEAFSADFEPWFAERGFGGKLVLQAAHRMEKEMGVATFWRKSKLDLHSHMKLHTKHELDRHLPTLFPVSTGGWPRDVKAAAKEKSKRFWRTLKAKRQGASLAVFERVGCSAGGAGAGAGAGTGTGAGAGAGVESTEGGGASLTGAGSDADDGEAWEAVPVRKSGKRGKRGSRSKARTVTASSLSKPAADEAAPPRAMLFVVNVHVRHHKHGWPLSMRCLCHSAHVRV